MWTGIDFPSEVVKNELQTYIGNRLTPQPTKVRADVEVTCYGYEGIDAVKEALRAAESKNTAEMQVKVKLVSPPLYVLTSQTLNKSAGISILREATAEIEQKIKAAGGEFKFWKGKEGEPRAVTEHDDVKLTALMEKSAKENQEVSGDEDVSESDENPIQETI